MDEPPETTKKGQQMKTFDYENAWLELALPAYKQLPNAALVLIEEVGIVADNLHQNSACDMVWPDDGGKLREMFDRLDSETLATAARVSYFYSHWRPGDSIAGDAPTVPCGWKFANYADQVLRGRFNVGRSIKSCIGLMIHEGAFRVGYSSRDMRIWEEVAPATEEGHKHAGAIAGRIRRSVAGKLGADADSAAYHEMEKIKADAKPGLWDTSRFMVEESELELRRAERMPKADKSKLIAEINATFEKDVANLTVERDGELWLVANDLPKDNAIYYKHTGQWCFGWRKPYTGKAREELLAKLAKFPFSYEIK